LTSGRESASGGKAYTPGPYAGKVVLFRATEESPGSAADETLGWRQAERTELIIHWVPGTHAPVIYSPLEPTLFLGQTAKRAGLLTPYQAAARELPIRVAQTHPDEDLSILVHLEAPIRHGYLLTGGYPGGRMSDTLRVDRRSLLSKTAF